RVTDGWTPDVIIGRREKDLDCSMSTLYRRFKDSALFDVITLPMQGKRKPNGHQEIRGKQGDKRSLDDRKTAYPSYKNEFGHLEGGTIIGKNHKNAVITFDCGKEFSNWKNLSNQQDISIFFADLRCPSQRGLNEHSNGLLRKDGLPKQMDFNEVSQEFITSVATRRNKIPRKSLNYKTPLEVFLDNVSGLDYF